MTLAVVLFLFVVLPYCGARALMLFSERLRQPMKIRSYWCSWKKEGITYARVVIEDESARRRLWDGTPGLRHLCQFEGRPISEIHQYYEDELKRYLQYFHSQSVDAPMRFAKLEAPFP